MSIFSKMMDKIFHRKPKVVAAAPAVAAPVAPPPVAAAPSPVAAPAVKVLTDVDVEAVLNEMASENPQKLNWRTSIVDLMKLLDMDSSLTERKALATELGYGDDMGDSAKMNIWLHKRVLHAFAENGGKIPADLLD
jgi:Domain of unknown function (DUF3597)